MTSTPSLLLTCSLLLSWPLIPMYDLADLWLTASFNTGESYLYIKPFHFSVSQLESQRSVVQKNSRRGCVYKRLTSGRKWNKKWKSSCFVHKPNMMLSGDIWRVDQTFLISVKCSVSYRHSHNCTWKDMHNGVSRHSCHRETFHNANVCGQNEDSSCWPRLV